MVRWWGDKVGEIVVRRWGYSGEILLVMRKWGDGDDWKVCENITGNGWWKGVRV